MPNLHASIVVSAGGVVLGQPQDAVAGRGHPVGGSEHLLKDEFRTAAVAVVIGLLVIIALSVVVISQSHIGGSVLQSSPPIAHTP